MAQPVIGLTLDSEPPGGYSGEPWYAIRENYCTAIAAAGGVPVALPHEPELAGRYLEMLDGLVITGGAFDVDPALFGAASRHETVTTKDRRTAFELAITRAAHAQAVPSLGICGGQQLMNVALGGSLIQHIPDAVPNALAHEQPNPRTEPGHAVSLETGSALHAIVGQRDHAGEQRPPPSGRRRGTRPRRQRARTGRRDRGHRGPGAPLVHRRAVAPGIRDRPPAIP